MDTVNFANAESKTLYQNYRETVFGDDQYKDIQKELIILEESKDHYMINVTDLGGIGDAKALEVMLSMLTKMEVIYKLMLTIIQEMKQLKDLVEYKELLMSLNMDSNLRKENLHLVH